MTVSADSHTSVHVDFFVNLTIPRGYVLIDGEPMSVTAARDLAARIHAFAARIQHAADRAQCAVDANTERT